MQLSFGAGALWGNRTDVTGSGIGPDQFGILQSVSVDFDWTTRELMGQFQFPVDIARGSGSIRGRASFARIFGALYGDLFFGSTPTTAGLVAVDNEAGTVPASSPYTIAVANAATFSDDLGVYYAAGNNAGHRFTRVTTPSGAGQYSVNLATGVYTFAAADALASLLISYLHTRATGKKITINNQIAGFTPTFKLTAHNEKRTQGTLHKLSITLNACTAASLSIPTRLDDYTIQEFNFQGFADAAGQIGQISTDE